MAEQIKVTEILARIDTSWQRLHRYLDTLTDEQLTRKTDAASWTVKDHAMHLSVWEGSLVALLNGKSRAEAVGVSQAMWDDAWSNVNKGGWDAINAVIQQRHRNLTMDEVKHALQASHAQVLELVGAMTEADLWLPYRHFQAAYDLDQPVANWIKTDTWEHYGEHLDWIKAIAEG